MKRLQLLLLALVVWFFLVFNLERFSSPINIASFVYVYITILAMLIILVPALRQKSPIGVFLFVLPTYFAVRAYLGYPIDVRRLPIIVTEMCAIGITVKLTGLIGRGLDQVQEVVANCTIGDLKEGIPEFMNGGQGWLYREIRRARAFSHPATLLVISPHGQMRENIPQHLVQEAQQKIMKHYVFARMAQVLKGVLRDCDVITQRDDDFIVLLPETHGENVRTVKEKVMKSAKDELGLDLQIGASTFPNEAVTFESLLTLAENALPTEKGSAVIQSSDLVSSHITQSARPSVFNEGNLPVFARNSLGLKMVPKGDLQKGDNTQEATGNNPKLGTIARK